jgi:hypothetical protein
MLYIKILLTEGTAALNSTVRRQSTEFQGYVNAGTAMSSYIVILALLLRLRQACDHPFLALGREAHEAPVEEGTDAIGAANSGTFVAAPGSSAAGSSAAAAANSSGSSSASDKITPSYVQQLYARFAAMAGHSSAAVMTPSKAARSSANNGASSSSGVTSSSKKRKEAGGQQQQQQQGSIAFVHKVVGELQAKGGLAASVSS